MSKITYKIRNYKLIEDLSGEFISGNFYVVKGGNNKGKTSFVKAFADTIQAQNRTNIPVTFGKADGDIKLTYTDPEDRIWNLKFDFTNENESFTLILPDTTKTKSVKEIRNSLKLNAFSVDDFFSWGLTAEGRRKQADVVKQLLSELDQTTLANIEGQISTKNGSLFKSRTNANNDYQTAKTLFDNCIVSDEQLNAIKKFDEDGFGEKFVEETNKLETNLQEKKNSLAIIMAPGYETPATKKLSFEKLIKDDQDEIVELQAKIKTLEERIAKNKENIVNLGKVEQEVSKEDLEKDIEILSTRLTNRKDAITFYNNAVIKKVEKKDLETKLQAKFKIFTDLDENIAKLRIQKNEIIKKVNFPFITIEDDELKYVDGDNLLPFNAGSISYAKAGLIVTRIIMSINKDLKLVLLGSAAEYDKKSREELKKIAEEFDGFIVGDEVVQDGELEIKVVE